MMVVINSFDAPLSAWHGSCPAYLAWTICTLHFGTFKQLNKTTTFSFLQTSPFYAMSERLFWMGSRVV
jgi:hypothetical protein